MTMKDDLLSKIGKLIDDTMADKADKKPNANEFKDRATAAARLEEFLTGGNKLAVNDYVVRNSIGRTACGFPDETKNQVARVVRVYEQPFMEDGRMRDILLAVAEKPNSFTMCHALSHHYQKQLQTVKGEK